MYSWSGRYSPICTHSPSIWTLTGQVLAAIRFVWETGIRHPRITTDNIFIDSKGRVKVGK